MTEIFAWTNEDVIGWLQKVRDRQMKATEAAASILDSSIPTKFFGEMKAVQQSTDDWRLYRCTNKTKATDETEEKIYLKCYHCSDSVAKWIKVDLFAYNIVMVPIHIPGHWTLAVIHMATKRIDYYDSMAGSGKQYLQTILEFLSNESMSKHGYALDINDWSCFSQKDIPQQNNGTDCGVFLCQFAECLSRGEPINFTQDQIEDLRKKMMKEIEKEKLH